MAGQPAAPANVSRLHPRGRPPDNLPAQPTPLLGRAPLVAALHARLDDPAVRLLTLTGPGGTGKTRLALAAARGVGDRFPHGTFLVDLAPLREPALLPAAIASVLHIRDIGSASALDALVAAVQQQQVLLLLDNFEHLLAGAPAIAELLASCPGVTLLVTSRAPLRLRWEQEFPVPPLALPTAALAGDLTALAATPAMELFVQRAQAIQPAFALTTDNAHDIAAICTQLDGLPLAIELAAARIRLLAPRALLARLVAGSHDAPLHLLRGGASDLPERQRSLRATIAWSYELLSPAERTLFRRLAVFAGGWTLDAVEAICAQPTAAAAPAAVPAADAASVLDGLAALVDQSLVVRTDDPAAAPRFRMLETIQEFSRELLVDSGEEAPLRRRHADYMLQFAQAARRAALGPAQVLAMQQLEADHHNLRAALAWALAHDDGVLALRLCAALSGFWYTHGHYREGRAWSTRALAATPQAPAATRAAALAGATTLAGMQQEYPAARALIEESVALWRTTVGDRLGLATSLALLGVIAWRQGAPTAARAACEEALALFATAPQPAGWGQRTALGVLGWLAADAGDDTTAHALLAQGLAIARADLSPLDLALQLNEIGLIELRQGDVGAAERHYREALQVSRDLDAKEPLTCSLEGLATVAAVRGQPQRAAWLLGAATTLRTASGVPRTAQFAAAYERLLPAVRQALREPAFAAATAAGSTAALAEVVAVALAEGDGATTPHWPAGSAGGRQAPARVVPLPDLTARQIEYLRLLARGQTNKAIAATLVVSETAVEQMLVRLYAKIDVHNRAEAIRFALDHGLSDAPVP